MYGNLHAYSVHTCDKLIVARASKTVNSKAFDFELICAGSRMRNHFSSQLAAELAESSLLFKQKTTTHTHCTHFVCVSLRAFYCVRALFMPCFLRKLQLSHPARREVAVRI